ncbi:MAG TPA: hypothetical protein VFZ77_18025 [Acidimicrobiales bacterium]
MRPAAPRLRRAVGAALAGLGALVLTAPPAAADPPQPTDYRATVRGIEPQAGAVEARVVGGDAFLELEVAEGHEVVVLGYGDEPYLRFRADGTVERNRRSEATYLNDDRRGAVDLPAAADNTADPEWEEVADGGAYAWHDHRIHWMGAGRPPGAEPGGVVQAWTVPLRVDGTPTDVRGDLVLVGGISPLPWLALGLAGLAAVVVSGGRRARVAGLAGLAALAAAAGAAVAGWAQYAAAPAGSGVDPLVVAVPLVGLVAAAAGVALRGRAAGPVATLAATAAVIGWATLRASVLWKPVLPTDLPWWLDRTATALGLGLAVAAAALVVGRGGLAAGLAAPGARGGADPAGARAGDADLPSPRPATARGTGAAGPPAPPP